MGLTAAELEAGLGISQVSVSQQVRFLTCRRLVHASREGKWVRYLIDSHFTERVREENHLAFLKYPETAMGHLYTTHAVESMSAGLERMRSALGATFPRGRRWI